MGDGISDAASKLKGLVFIQVSPLPSAEHCEFLAPSSLLADLGSRDDVKVGVGDYLRRGCPVVLHHIPIAHARGASQCCREDAQPIPKLPSFCSIHFGEFLAVLSWTEQQMAVGQGGDVKEG